MRLRGSKGGVPPRKDEGPIWPFGKKLIPTGSVEISLHCHKHWDFIIAAPREYFRDNYQGLQSICRNPLMMTKVSAYEEYQPPIATAAELDHIDFIGGLTELQELKRMMFMEVWGARYSDYLNSLSQQQQQATGRSEACVRHSSTPCWPSMPLS